MRKKLIEARASALNEVAAKKGGSVFVLASKLVNMAPEYSAHQETSSHSCEECGTGFSTVAGLTPFCPNCGSGQVKASDEQAQALPKTDQELSFLVCPSPKCGTANILHDVTAKMFDGRFHCVCCSEKIDYEVKADGEGSEPVVMEHRDPDGKIAEGDDSKMGDAPATEIKETVEDTKQPQVNPPVLSEKTETADEKGVHVPQETGEQDRPIKDADAKDVIDAVENDKLKGIPSVQKADAGEAPLNDPIVEDLDDEDLEGGEQQMNEGAATVEAADESDQDMKDEQQSCESAVRTSVLSTILAFKGEKELSFGTQDRNVIAFVNNMQVASLSPEQAGKNAEHMYKASFASAVAKQVESAGLKDGLTSFGFELSKISIPQKAIISKLVAKQTKVESSKLREEASEFTEKFKQCLSIAAAGLNKGFFAKEENALKRGFYDALSAVGIKSAEKLIDKVFSSNGDTYHRTLLEKAFELMDKPIEVRNSMAETVQATSYMATAADDDQEEDDGDSEQDASVLSALEKASIIPIRSTTKSAKPETAGASTIRQLVSGSSLFQRS